MLDKYGITPTLVAQGLVCPHWQVRLHPSGEHAQFDLSVLADVTAHPSRLQCEQFKLSRALLARLAAGTGTLLVAGEALSQCVAASGDDMLAHMGDTALRNCVFLTDCMSPVPGFEADGQQFLARLHGRGVRTMTTARALEELA